MLRIKRKGQSTLEYSALIIIILAAFLTVQNYVKRGIQGRWKSASDDLGDQYDPRTATTRINYTLESNTDTTIRVVDLLDAGGQTVGQSTTRRETTNSIEKKSGESTIGAY